MFKLFDTVENRIIPNQPDKATKKMLAEESDLGDEDLKVFEYGSFGFNELGWPIILDDSGNWAGLNKKRFKLLMAP